MGVGKDGKWKWEDKIRLKRFYKVYKNPKEFSCDWDQKKKLDMGNFF